jgi:hypothetical protein
VILDNHVKPIVVVAVASAVLSGVVAWHQHSGAVRLEDEAGSLTAELASKQAVVQEQKTLLGNLERDNEAYRAELEALRKADIDAASSNSTEIVKQEPVAVPKNDAVEVFARVSEDPTMKEIVREWNSAKIKQLYGDFAKDHHLSPLQAKQFFDLLTEERMRVKDEYFATFATGEADTGLSKTRIESWLKQKGEIDRQLKMLLGSDNYAEFDEYRKSEGY